MPTTALDQPYTVAIRGEFGTVGWWQNFIRSDSFIAMYLTNASGIIAYDWETITFATEQDYLIFVLAWS